MRYFYHLKFHLFHSRVSYVHHKYSQLDSFTRILTSSQHIHTSIHTYHFNHLIFVSFTLALVLLFYFLFYSLIFFYHVLLFFTKEKILFQITFLDTSKVTFEKKYTHTIIKLIKHLINASLPRVLHLFMLHLPFSHFE